MNEAETHVYCCDRCGEIFEDVEEQAFCEECRKALSQPAARVIVYEHTCIRCGKTYQSKAVHGKYCSSCRNIVHAEQKQQWGHKNPINVVKTKRSKSRGQKGIIEDAKRAADLGMSYGAYKAKYGEG